MVGKIDTHHHFLPAVYFDAVGLDTLARMMPNQKAPAWSSEGALAKMDANGIETAKLVKTPTADLRSFRTFQGSS